MRNFLIVFAALTLGQLLFAPAADAQCDANYVTANIQGAWKVNNPGSGPVLGGVFIGKPQVNIALARRGYISIDGIEFMIGNSFAPEANPRGGTWCSFVLHGVPARIMKASNNWWMLEIGEHNERNKIELIRR